MRHDQPVKAGFVLGPTMGTSAWRDAEVMAASKGQASVEGGCRVLNDPLWVGSSWLGKQPRRLEGRLRMMTRAWLVDSVAQRRMRQP